MIFFACLYTTIKVAHRFNDNRFAKFLLRISIRILMIWRKKSVCVCVWYELVSRIWNKADSSTFEKRKYRRKKHIFHAVFHSMEMLNWIHHVVEHKKKHNIVEIITHKNNLDRFNYLIENIGNTNVFYLSSFGFFFLMQGDHSNHYIGSTWNFRSVPDNNFQ